MSGLSFVGKFLQTNKYGLRKIKQFNQVTLFIVISFKKVCLRWKSLQLNKKKLLYDFTKLDVRRNASSSSKLISESVKPKLEYKNKILKSKSSFFSF